MPSAAVAPILKETPFHERTAPIVRAQTWRRWAGYQVASAYEPHPDREYAAIRNAAALIDVSPLYKYRLTGRDAARLLDRMVTRDVMKAKVGQVLYTPWCDARGKVIDDGTISRLDDTTFGLTSAEPNLRGLTMTAVGLDVAMADVSEATGALALQGPLSRTILQQVSPADFSSLKYFRLVHTTVRDIPVTISRTGYTGDLGYELWVDAPRAGAGWGALVDAGAPDGVAPAAPCARRHGVGRDAPRGGAGGAALVDAGTPYGLTPAGIWALDLARIEAGLIMLDVDYFSSHRAVIEDQKSSPYEINLAWAVSDDKGPFNGRRALRDEKRRGSAWAFVGLDVDWNSISAVYAERDLPPALPTVAWRTSAPVYRGGRQIGYATSGCWSPLLKKYLALAHLTAPHFATGTSVELEIPVEHRRQRAEPRVTKLPFFDPPRRRQ